MTTIAVELDKIYPIPGRKSKGKRYVTIGDVFEEAYEANPEPKPQFKNRYNRLNDFYTTDEWNILEELNNAVNPKLRSVLEVLFDGHSKKVILPIEVSHLGPGYQRIAKIPIKIPFVMKAPPPLAAFIFYGEESLLKFHLTNWQSNCLMAMLWGGGSPDADKKL